jgi:hypothetical protein
MIAKSGCHPFTESKIAASIAFGLLAIGLRRKQFRNAVELV